MFTKYSSRGVSATKEEVHSAIKNLDGGLFPKSFCKVFPDYLTGDEKYCISSHADGSGTKSVLAYLYWKETGDLSIWKNVAIDAIVMNTDDLLSIGAVDNFIYTSIIGRNKNLIPGEVLKTIIESTSEFFDLMSDWGINIKFLGGETADLGDVVRTITIDGNMTCRMRRSDVIDNSKISAGNVIIGFGSSGQSKWETDYNSGIGSNGLTSARHDLLLKYYEDKYPESFDPNTNPDVIFCGKYYLEDSIKGLETNLGKLLLSPTRTYLPLAKKIFENIERSKIHGIIHCTGGGSTKVLNFIDNLKVVKDNLFDLPIVFDLIRKSAGYEMREMYGVFNMGHRLEMYVDESVSEQILQISESLGIESKIIGKVYESEKTEVVIDSKYGNFTYNK